MQTIFINYDLCVGGKSEYNLEFSKDDGNYNEKLVGRLLLENCRIKRYDSSKLTNGISVS